MTTLWTLTAAARLARAGREIVANGDDQRPPDQSLLQLLARSHDIKARLVQNPALAVRDVARAEGVSSAYVYCLLRLPWLATDIAAAIVKGRNPLRLTTKADAGRLGRPAPAALISR